MPDEQQLKPCPFCGETEIFVRNKLDDYGNPICSYFVQCSNDMCAALMEDFHCIKDARTAWNRRPEPEGHECWAVMDYLSEIDAAFSSEQRARDYGRKVNGPLQDTNIVKGRFVEDK